MIRKTLVLLPVLALAGLGVAHAQSGGGQMAYPTPTQDGIVKIPGSRAPDTGSMGYPASPGGITTSTTRGNDAGSAGAQSGGATMSTPRTGGASMATPAAVPDASDAAATPPATHRRHRRAVRRHAAHPSPAANSTDTPAQ